jgi:hypothetical protein
LIEFNLVPFHEIAEYVARNVDQHVLDSGYGKRANLDWDYYLAASHSGECVAIVVTDDEKTVGYSVFFVSNNPNHKHIIEANNSGIYLEKKYRGKTSIQLFKKADELLKALGVSEINYLLKDDRVGKILSRNGYRPEHKLWSVKL